MDLQAEAFAWIVGILKKHKISFLVSGGLSARAYGSTRPLYDFDFDVEPRGLEKIMEDVKFYAVSGPKRRRGEWFENILLQLDYKGQRIDLADTTDTKIFNKKNKKWEPDITDLNRYEFRDIFGIKVPVTLPEDLIAYKNKLLRKEDIADIEAVERYLKKKSL